MAALAALLIGYLISFLVSYRPLGMMAGALGMLPAAFAGTVFGRRAGLWVALGLSVTTTAARLWLEPGAIIVSAPTLVGMGTLFVVGVGAGLAREFVESLRRREAVASRNEAHLRALIASIPDTLVRVSADMVVLDAWRPELMLGACKKPPTPGCPIAECGGPEVLGAVAPMLAAARTGATPSSVITFGEGATKRWVEARVTAANGDHLLLFRDVTSEKTIEAQLVAAEGARVLAETRARLDQSQRLASLGTLAAGIAHEINNPLTYVIGNLDLIDVERPQTPEANADLRELLTEAREGARRIAAIVRDMRMLSREASRDAAAPFSVARAIRAAANLSKGALSGRAELLVQLEHAGEVLGSETRLAQVFVNLLVNAAQAMPHRPQNQNRIIVRALEASSDQVSIMVEDNGAGIAPAVLAQIFDPFFTTKPAGEGTGLGLSISRTIVEEMGGSLIVSSEVGAGTCVTVTLPASQPSHHDDGGRATH